MKQKSFLSIFSAVFFFTFFFPIASAHAEGLFVIGDSIAVGLSERGGLNPDGYHAKGGAQAREIAGFSISGPAGTTVISTNPARHITRFSASGSYDRIVISAGSNAPQASRNASDLETIRNRFPNARAVWVVPYNATAAGVVRQVARAHPGDALVELSNYPSNDNVHPNSSSDVGTAVRQAIGSGGTTTPSQGQSGGTTSAIALTETPIQGGGGGGLIPCGRKAGQGTLSEPCTACHAVLAGKNLLDYLTGIMVVVAIAVIVGMGVLYIMSGVNTTLKEIAKKGLTAVLIGLVLMLSAWLIVSTILRFLASPAVMQGGDGFIGLQAGQGVYGLQCSATSLGGRGVLVRGGRIVGDGGSQGQSYTSTGTCQAGSPASNPCSPQSLASTCFAGPNVNTWSAICQAESNGNVSIPSGTDRCTDANRTPVSFGLFQINISANRIGNLDCPNAFNKPFSGSDHNCRVTNPDLYNQCKAAAINATQNIQTACRLAGNGARNTGPWGAARRCNIPRNL